MSFAGKSVLITGATSGIGRETAIQFARAGARVVLAGRRQEAGEQVVKEITESGGTAIFVQTDVTSEEDVKQLVEKAKSEYGRIDIAFNNAGVENGSALTEFTVNDYRQTFDVNVLGVLLSLKYEIPVMLEQGGGVIVNTSSVLGHIAVPGAGIYNASKHAVEGITKTAALEYAQQGIRVNSVAPGATETSMIDRFAGEEGTEGRQQLAGMHPMGRMGRPEEIARAVLYLASDEASFTTGISLPVDGGWLAQ